MVGGTTPCTFVDFEAEKVAAVEEFTGHGAVHYPAVATVEKEGVKTVEIIRTQVDVFLSLFFVYLTSLRLPCRNLVQTVLVYRWLPWRGTMHIVS